MVSINIFKNPFFKNRRFVHDIDILLIHWGLTPSSSLGHSMLPYADHWFLFIYFLILFYFILPMSIGFGDRGTSVSLSPLLSSAQLKRLILFTAYSSPSFFLLGLPGPPRSGSWGGGGHFPSISNLFSPQRARLRGYKALFPWWLFSPFQKHFSLSPVQLATHPSSLSAPVYLNFASSSAAVART